MANPKSTQGVNNTELLSGLHLHRITMESRPEKKKEKQVWRN